MVSVHDKNRTQIRSWRACILMSSSLRCRLYTLRFNFLPHEMYADEYILTPSHILHSMEHRFLRRLQDAITKQQNDLKAAQ